ncbi:hypothetical protein M378DRAFT_159947 [Amanita muscaria Koide BX008]|uniref:Uncharacterized protein n=1 Tax=Amanita muscaria (strain Koide BX008) TaxID=946122 RepID=A0A0C2WYW2_AMAMK|nr:hypothetical protein M378DRAFT_159947 [Amanita muscaria Koide BX008]
MAQNITATGTPGPNHVETYTIFPTNKYNRPPPPPSIPLHGLDTMAPPIHILNHRFYHSPQPGVTPSIIDKLKSSLAEALELYAPISGTVRSDDNGDVYIATDTENIQGTPFLVEMRDVPFAGDTEDLSPRTVVLLPPGSSTLAVKVTQFLCGTIAVAASINHQVTDLRGFLDFLELWAQIARGEAIAVTQIPQDWSHTPGRFFSGLTGKSIVPIPPPGFAVLPVPATGALAALLAPSKVTRWKFTKSAVEQLKTDFSPSVSSEAHKSGLWISSGDALAALLWGVITRARENAHVSRLEGRSTVESQTETLMMAADGRGRSPQGKMLYFGNFNPLFYTIASRSDLLSLTYESASRVALEIRNALNLQISPEAIADKISFYEDPKNAKPPGRITWSGDVIMTNWCRFDLQCPKLDFGWGKPFSATAGAGGVYPPGYVMMTQEKDSGDIFILLTVEQQGAERMVADPLLNRYASLIARG